MSSRVLRAVVVCAALFGIVVFRSNSVVAVSADVVISQIYGGGGNAGARFRNDFIELFNNSDVAMDLTGWSVQYASAAGSTWQVTNLTGSIPARGFYLVQEAAGSGGTDDLPTPDASGNISMAAAAGKVALVRNQTPLTSGGGPNCAVGTAIVDFVGYGSANCFEGAAAPALSNTTAALRKASGATQPDTDRNGTDFLAGSPNPRGSGIIITVPVGRGTATPDAVAPGDATLLTVAVTPGAAPTSTGIAVVADLTSIGGSSTQPFFDDQTNGDVTAGDNMFTLAFTVPLSVGTGVKTIAANIVDAQLRSSTTSFTVSLVGAAPKGVVISQVYGGGGNSGARFRNDYIELFNTTTAPVSLSGWSVQYSSAGGASWQVTALTGTIQPNSYYLVSEAAGNNASAEPLPQPDDVGTIAMAAGSGKVALTSTTAALTGACPASSIFVADFVGYGSANCFEGAGAAQALSNTTAALRLNGGDVDTDDNRADFIVGDPKPHNHEGIPPSGAGAATPQAVPSGGTTLLTVTVISGERPVNTSISVSGDLSPIGGAADVPFFDDGTHGDLVAHDNVFSLSTIVTGTAGVKALALEITDTVPRTGPGTIALAIETTTTAIHNIQGPGSASPFATMFVTTTGIVTGLKFNGVFVQVRDGETDADVSTSEGVFVFTGRPPAFVATGQEVFVSGTVQEFVPEADPASPPVTEIINAFFRVAASGQPLPQPVILLPSYTNPGGTFEQLERFEGMRVTANIVAISPTQGTVDETNATSTSNGVFHAVIQGVARPFREPGLEPDQSVPSGPDAPAHVPRFDGNPERLRVDSDALLGAPPIEIAAGQTISGLTGPLDYGFRTYSILPDPPSVSGSLWTPSGSAMAVPVPVPSAGEFTVGHFNFERFFDDVDDADVDDPILTTNALNGRLAKASLAVRHVLRSPDILGVVEVENLSVLQRLADQINAEAIRDGETDPQYKAFLEEGNDIGGIDVGFLVKTAGDRVSEMTTEQIGKDETYTQPNGEQAVLNDRPSLALKAVITSPLGTRYPVTVIVNHLRSLSGIDGADGARIREKRRAQAEFMAKEIQRRQAAEPGERIISVGDYNAFQFNDGYVDVIGTIKGTPTPADQVVLASPDLVDPDLTNAVDLLPAEQRYSFSFDGNAQAIDHVLVNEPARRRISRMAYGRLDVDFPESFRNDVNRPERLSDHDAAIAYFAFPEAPVLTLNGSDPLTVEAFTSFTDPGAVAVDRGATPDQDRPLPVTVTGAVDVTKPGTYSVAYTASNGFLETSVHRTVIVRDTIAPSIEGFTVSPASISPPNHRLVVITLSYVSTDASRAVTCMPAVSSNESPNATGDGNTAIDAVVTDSRHVKVRSERSGANRDRIYTIALSCADPSGNVSRQTRTVTVR